MSRAKSRSNVDACADCGASGKGLTFFQLEAGRKFYRSYMDIAKQGHISMCAMLLHPQGSGAAHFPSEIITAQHLEWLPISCKFAYDNVLGYYSFGNSSCSLCEFEFKEG